MNKDANSTIISCLKCGAKNRVSIKTASRPVCGSCRTPLLPSGKPIVITDQNFLNEVEKSKLPVLIDFWAAWCGPCRIVGPTIDAVASEVAGKVKVGKLDIDQNPQTASRFRVQSIPTLLIFNGGREVARLVGVQSKEAILHHLKGFL